MSKWNGKHKLQNLQSALKRIQRWNVVVITEAALSAFKSKINNQACSYREKEHQQKGKMRDERQQQVRPQWKPFNLAKLLISKLKSWCLLFFFTSPNPSPHPHPHLLLIFLSVKLCIITALVFLWWPSSLQEKHLNLKEQIVFRMSHSTAGVVLNRALFKNIPLLLIVCIIVSCIYTTSTVVACHLCVAWIKVKSFWC